MTDTNPSKVFHSSVVSVVERLKEMGVPLFSFAQTIFWDDPMKAILLRALGEFNAPNRFIAGVHDTDYFSKLPHAPSGDSRFLLVSRNDGSTKELWAATVETAALFGSETPASEARLLECGVALSRLCSEDQRCTCEDADPADVCSLDRVTEAWGWRAVAYRGDHAPVAHEVPLGEVLAEVRALIEWGVKESLNLLHWPLDSSPCRHEQAAQELLQILEEEASDRCDRPLWEFYAAVIPRIYRWLMAHSHPDDSDVANLEVSACSRHFQFSSATCDLPRFRIVERFLNPSSRAVLSAEYDRATAGSGIYGLSRFGDGALPFDLMVPGLGRGTLLVAPTRCALRLPDHEVVISQGKPIQSVDELARAVESKFGPQCALMGKALVLPVMFASEGVMVLNEGASSYIPRTQQWVRAARERGVDLPLHPLLRIRYHTFDSLSVLDAEFHLPRHLQETFCHRTNPFPARRFAQRWREVLDEQREQLRRLAEIRSSRDLIPFLATDSTCGPSEYWNTVLGEYRFVMGTVHKTGATLTEFTRGIDAMKEQRQSLEKAIAELEHQSGQLRRKVLGDDCLDESERETLTAQRGELLHRVADLRAEIGRVESRRKELGAQANWLRLDNDYIACKQRMRAIELDAEKQRLRLVRNALLTRGIEVANRRPCAWWFPVVDPSGKWWEQVTRTTEMFFEEW